MSIKGYEFNRIPEDGLEQQLFRTGTFKIERAVQTDLCYIYARIVAGAIEFWEHRVVADTWTQLGSVAWSMQQARRVITGYDPKFDRRGNEIGSHGPTRFDYIDTWIWESSTRPSTPICDLGGYFQRRSYSSDDEFFSEPETFGYDTSAYPYTYSDTWSWAPAKLAPQVPASLGTPYYFNSVMAGHNLVVVPQVVDGSRWLEVRLLSRPSGDYSYLAPYREVRLYRETYPEYDQIYLRTGVYLGTSGDRREVRDTVHYDSVNDRIYGNFNTIINSTGGPSWAAWPAKAPRQQLFPGVVDVNVERVPFPSLAQALNGQGIAQSEKIIVSGDGSGTPASLSFPSISHRGYAIGNQGIKGRVVFDLNGDRFPAVLQSETLQDPHYCWRTTGISVLRTGQRLIKLAVLDAGTLPASITNEIAARNADGNWYQFGHPDWPMDESWWPCAAAYW